MDCQELHKLIEKIFVCDVCKGRLEAPVFCCEEGHTVCGKCRRGDDFCGVCSVVDVEGNVLAGSQNFNQQTLLNNLVKAFKFSCKFLNQGCKEVGIPDNLKLHEKDCDFRLISCILSKNGSACNDSISILKYGNHINACHDSYVVPYSLNSCYNTKLPKRANLENNLFHYRVLKSNNLYFLEMIYYDNQLKAYQISVHYIGMESEAANYIYCLEIKCDSKNMECKYKNCCLANIMTPEEVRKKSPFLLFDENDKFSVHNEVMYNVKIMKKEDYSNKRPQNKTVSLQRPKLPKTVFGPW